MNRRIIFALTSVMLCHMPDCLAQTPSIRPGEETPATDPALAKTLHKVPDNELVYQTQLLSAEFAKPTVEFMGERAMLTGFEVSAGKSGDVEIINSLLPIYLVNGRQTSGQLLGKQLGSRTQLFAREGYAVKSVETDTAGYALMGLRVNFARIMPDGTLSPTDEYASRQIGRAPAKKHEADGLPFCGIATLSARMSSLSLLVSKPLVDKSRPALVPSATTVSAEPITPRRITPMRPDGPTPPTPGIEPVPRRFIVPPPIVTEKMSELAKSTSHGLVFVEGGEGVGSGFVGLLGGKVVVFTNQHVVGGNTAVKFTTLDKGEVKIGTARAAVAHDIMAYEVADVRAPLDIMTNFTEDVATEDEVIVLGNTEGARVIKPLPGKIVGIGPNLIEVSSEFLPGNSGSPIIHVKSGKVIGIATYAIVRTVNSLTGQNEPTIRRFGYRLDSVQNWQGINWQLYNTEAVAAKKVTDFSGALVNLLRDLNSGQFLASRHADSRLKTALSHLTRATGSAAISQADRTRYMQNFIGELRNVVQKDVEELKPRLKYDFFQRTLAEEAKFRAELYKGLGEAMKNVR